MPFHCRELGCGRKQFSAKGSTVMEGSKIGSRDQVSAMFLVTANRESSFHMKLDPI